MRASASTARCATSGAVLSDHRAARIQDAAQELYELLREITYHSHSVFCGCANPDSSVCCGDFEFTARARRLLRELDAP